MEQTQLEQLGLLLCQWCFNRITKGLLAICDLLARMYMLKRSCLILDKGSSKIDFCFKRNFDLFFRAYSKVLLCKTFKDQ